MSAFRTPQLSGTPHVMPSPPSVPWNADAMPWTITRAPYTGVMEFNAPQMANFGKKIINNHKRKSAEIVPLPTKQFITEEKMAAHLNGLHISSDYVSHNSNSAGESSSQCGFSDMAMESDADSEFIIPMSAKDLEEKLKNASRITICEQIRKLNEDDSIIPKALMGRTENPCTALVLWQPPPKLSNDIAEKQKNPDDIDPEDIEDEDKDNNNSSSLDFNYTMETDM